MEFGRFHGEDILPPGEAGARVRLPMFYSMTRRRAAAADPLIGAATRVGMSLATALCVWTGQLTLIKIRAGLLVD